MVSARERTLSGADCTALTDACFPDEEMATSDQRVNCEMANSALRCPAPRSVRGPQTPRRDPASVFFRREENASFPSRPPASSWCRPRSSLLLFFLPDAAQGFLCTWRATHSKLGSGRAREERLLPLQARRPPCHVIIKAYDVFSCVNKQPRARLAARELVCRRFIHIGLGPLDYVHTRIRGPVRSAT